MIISSMNSEATVSWQECRISEVAVSLFGIMAMVDPKGINKVKGNETQRKSNEKTNVPSNPMLRDI